MTEPDEAHRAWDECAADRWQDEENGNPLGLSQGMPNFEDFRDGYRAGAAASEARIKALEEALRDALPHLENCFTHHGWHSEQPREPEYLVNIRALLKEADQ